MRNGLLLSPNCFKSYHHLINCTLWSGNEEKRHFWPKGPTSRDNYTLNMTGISLKITEHIPNGLFLSLNCFKSCHHLINCTLRAENEEILNF